jgi:putative membrane protein
MRIAWLAAYFLVLLWSGIGPRDSFTWCLEVAPAVIGLVIMAATFRRFPLTRLLYGLILFHCVILMVGGHYTYAEVPFFDRIGAWFGAERNNYDKLAHFVQGFVPAILAREILIRNHVVPSDRWRDFLVVCVCLAFSAFYELVEWGVAVATGESADAFLGTQGYVWDTQTDMALALVGAVSALLVLGRVHDRSLARLGTLRDLVHTPADRP